MSDYYAGAIKSLWPMIQEHSNEIEEKNEEISNLNHDVSRKQRRKDYYKELYNDESQSCYRKKERKDHYKNLFKNKKERKDHYKELYHENVEKINHKQERKDYYKKLACQQGKELEELKNNKVMSELEKELKNSQKIKRRNSF